MQNINFGEALAALKNGKAVARSGWNGKGMLVFLNKGNICAESPQSEMVESIPVDLFERGDPGTVTRLPNLNMRAASGATVTGWLASQTDLLAEDWQILE